MKNPPQYDRDVTRSNRAWIAGHIGEAAALGLCLHWILARGKPETPEFMCLDLRFFAAVAGLMGRGAMHDRRIAEALAVEGTLPPDYQANLQYLLDNVNPTPEKRKGRPPKSHLRQMEDDGAAMLVYQDMARGIPLHEANRRRAAEIGKSTNHLDAARQRIRAPDAPRYRAGKLNKKGK